MITVNELFSGIGAQRKALLNLGFEVDVVGISEIDKYAIQSYEAIFGKTFNYGDICKVSRLEYADLWTYSFPCQDISVAGYQKGITKDTRSGLLYEVQRLLEVAKDEGNLPKYLLLENVKNLVGKKFKSQFDNWLFYLDELGYKTYWQVLNAKNYGVPQNRERVFAISIRKDLNETFEFPKAEELTLRLKDILEDEVDEKYYLNQTLVDYFIKNSLSNEEKGNGFRFKPHNPQNADVAFAVTTRAGGRMDDNYISAQNLSETSFFQFDKENVFKLIGASRGRNAENTPTEQRLEINTQGTTNTITTVQKDNYVIEAKIQQVKGNLYPNSENPQAGRVYKPEGISPALDTCQGGNRQPKIIIDDTQGFDGVRTYENYAPTLRAQRSGLKTTDGIRIRKLTPLECWRLMGFDDEDFNKAQKSGVSNTQLYKQAGNSIVVNVLEKIFKNLFEVANG